METRFLLVTLLMVRQYAILTRIWTAIHSSKGEFAGTISAALDPEYFNVLLRSVLDAPDRWASLAHGDGKVFLFMPPNEQALVLHCIEV